MMPVNVTKTLAFLADRTSDRAYATVSVVCNVIAKQCFLPKISLKKQIGNGLWEIEWSRDR